MLEKFAMLGALFITRSDEMSKGREASVGRTQPYNDIILFKLLKYCL